MVEVWTHLSVRNRNVTKTHAVTAQDDGKQPHEDAVGREDLLHQFNYVIIVNKRKYSQPGDIPFSFIAQRNG